ncbi:MAG: hypothetical protein QXH66_06370 [Conexivisphaerales archaeon]
MLYLKVGLDILREITRSLLKYLKPMQEVRFTHIIMLSMAKKKKFEPIKAKGDDKEEPTISKCVEVHQATHNGRMIGFRVTSERAGTPSSCPW